MQLKSLRRWCMERISLHSLSGEHEDAQAMSDEHMEMLMGANEEHTLWMRIEKTAEAAHHTQGRECRRGGPGHSL